MYPASTSHLDFPWKSLLFTALLVLPAACGGAGEGLDPASPAVDPEQESEPSTEGSRVGTPSPVLPPAGPQATPWFQRLGGPQDDVGTGLAVDETGHVSVTWVSTPRQDADREPVEGERLALHLSRYTSEGELVWTREFPRNRVDSLRVVASPGGDLFVSGNAFLYSIDFGLGEASAGFLVKFTADGTPVWQRRVGQKVYASVADGSGGVLVAGESWTGGRAPLIARYDAEGTQLWSRRLDTLVEGSELRAVARDASGQLLLAGRLEGVLRVDGRSFGAPDTQGLLLLAFDPDGQLAWGREWAGVDGHVSALEADAEGGAVLVGDLAELGTFVRAAGREGEERWTQALACGASTGVSGTAPGVTRDADGRVLALCGDILSTYAADGAQLDQRPLAAGACVEHDCQVTITALGLVPGGGLALTGVQRHGDAETGNQEAFARILMP